MNKLQKLFEQLRKRESAYTHVGKSGAGDDAVFKQTALRAVGTLEEIRKSVDDESAGFSIPFQISDSDPDRDTDTVSAKGVDLTNFKAAGGVVLFAHNQKDLPVAKAPDTFEENDVLKSTAQFPSRDLYKHGNTVGRLVLNGYLGAASIGFLPKQYSFNEERGPWAVDFTEAELLEWSVVPVPANPRALAGAKAAGIELETVVEWCEKMLDGAGSLVVPSHVLEEARKAASGDPVVVGGFSLKAVEADEGNAAEDADAPAGESADEPETPAEADEGASEAEAEAEPTDSDAVESEASEDVTGKMLSLLGSLTQAVENFGKRLDAIEGKEADDEQNQSEPLDVVDESENQGADDGADKPDDDGLTVDDVKSVLEEVVREHQWETGALPVD